jgi:small nuclear ribonucleoprotein (snRNP)-like protein
MAGREVLLYVNREVIEAIGVGGGAGVQDFINALKLGPPSSPPGNVCEKACDLYELSRANPRNYPLYIAYLALFVYAGTIEGDFDDKAYYPRLYEALGEPIATLPYPSFARMAPLWEDLERWSKREKGEKVGRFTFRRRGGWVNVGIPLSQLILSEQERGHLPQIFYQASIDPADPPPDRALRRALLDYGRLLRARTRKLLDLDNVGNNELLAALLDFVLEELALWDGNISEQSEGTSVTERPHSAPQKTDVRMHICLENIDMLSRTVNCRARIKTNREIPEDGLFLDEDESTYTCKESLEPSWTTRLRKDSTSSSAFFDAARLDWVKGAIFRDHENNWVARLKGAPVRLFMQRPLQSITGWIEHSQLAYHSEFVIACHRDWLGKVETWGETCGVLKRSYVSGLPANWVLLEGKDATASSPGIDVLTLPKQLHLHLHGGVKTGKGIEYLHFAPPTLVISGATGEEDVALNGQALEPAIAGTWQLPPEAQTNTTLEIQVRDRESKDVLRRRFIKLTDPSVSAEFETTRVVDEFGQVLSAGDALDEASYVSGAVIYGAYKEEPYTMEEPPAAFYQSQRIQTTEPVEVLTGIQTTEPVEVLTGTQTKRPFEVLSCNISKSVSVRLKSAQVVKGTFLGYDPHWNILLAEAELHQNHTLVTFDVLILRGDSVLYVSGLDDEFDNYRALKEKKPYKPPGFVRLTEPSISAKLETTVVVDKFGYVMTAGDKPGDARCASGAVVYGTYEGEPYVIEQPPAEFYWSRRTQTEGPVEVLTGSDGTQTEGPVEVLTGSDGTQTEGPVEVLTGSDGTQTEGPVEVLSHNIGKSVSIHLKSAQVVTGTFLGFDRHLNISLAEAELCEKKDYFPGSIVMRETLGKISLHGDRVLYVSDSDREFNYYRALTKKRRYTLPDAKGFAPKESKKSRKHKQKKQKKREEGRKIELARPGWPSYHPEVYPVGSSSEQSHADASSAEVLVQLLQDSETASDAAIALGELGDKRAVEPLITALWSHSKGGRKGAAIALGQLRDERAVEPLITALSDDSPDVVRSAATALGELGDKRAVEPLITALKSHSEGGRKGAAIALGQLRDERAVEPLINALRDRRFSVRREAAHSLMTLGDKRARGPLQRLLQDSNSQVKKAAEEALQKLSDN